jgi:exopolysaccharide production protein ExoY
VEYQILADFYIYRHLQKPWYSVRDLAPVELRLSSSLGGHSLPMLATFGKDLHCETYAKSSKAESKLRQHPTPHYMLLSRRPGRGSSPAWADEPLRTRFQLQIPDAVSRHLIFFGSGTYNENRRLSVLRCLTRETSGRIQPSQVKPYLWSEHYMPKAFLNRASFPEIDEEIIVQTRVENAFVDLSQLPIASLRYRLVKRVLDIILSALMLLVFAIPAIIIAAAIRLTSKGPIFYRERRVGRNGVDFWIWKFRSMGCTGDSAAPRLTVVGGKQQGVRDLEWRIRKDGTDPRITRLGGFLRRWSLDEIPQLFNVLRGEMSLVGPRPIIRSETAFYGSLFSYYVAATPGLSGLWQVSGRSDVGYARRIELDATYVGSWKLRTDLAILLRTVPAVLSRTGAR